MRSRITNDISTVRRAALGRTLIIANPAAQSGAGKQTAERLQRFLALYHHDGASFELIYTKRPGHAAELAAEACGYESVLALGGDGVVHEVANGLMRIDAARRPSLGVVPVGSGNDFARTHGLKDYTGSDFARYLTCERVPFDVGRITYRPAATEGKLVEHFVQTLSFGLDAAVALGTVDLRARVPLSGMPLYVLSGADVFLRTFRPYPAQVAIDGDAPRKLRTFLMAIQLGPTYGSGFLVCPDADPTDGRFDLCYASGRASRLHALALLLQAKRGHHTRSHLIHITTARHVELAFERDDYPIQADGERIRARSMTVDLLPGALTVLRPL